MMRLMGLETVFGVCLWLLLTCGVCYGDSGDVACLRSIKASLEDPFNYLNSSWDFSITTQGFICRFVGIDCWHPDENRVLNIRLSGMGFKGKFPRGISNCTSLTGLDLSSNNLSGTIPTDISTLMPYATYLDLSSNKFLGRIPKGIANCSYLNVLKLDHNHLSGQIPSVIGLLRRIKTFSVANNFLSGPVPEFSNVNISADSYANNTGLCGKPLDPCPATGRLL